MMEIEGSAATTPRGTPTPGSPNNNTAPGKRLMHHVGRFHHLHHSKATITTQLAPNTEYEVSASSNTPTASPLQARHYSSKVATPSPDSAIHSAYYSPSQSPVQSRHVSGFSSPFSLRTTPSLSRNNSDASQYGGSQYSYSSTSPLSPTQFSPSHSPVQGRHAAHLPSSPLPPARHLSLPALYAAAAAGGQQAAIILRSEENNRRTSPMADITESTAEDDKGAAGAAQAQAAGISRQQLINRCEHNSVDMRRRRLY